ncbi:MULTISPECIES: DUF1861 family protein [unclassified Sporolactobacillus]|uniref:DUF1861 family protein n=1 Tax=unclassified Sporolactobacillus TaxID=2628533 RepID=UPI002367FCBE|nr:DUF1861 family protein [Sporolactobacillus sp. CQH2019]MDD9148998.1 DUF1861 family protein [Sporolactobacillus sp. CQH2019]
MGHPKDCIELLERYEKAHPRYHSVEKLHFTGVGRRDVYNITAPFCDENRLVIAGRVETRKSEDSIVVFFEKRDRQWQRIHHLPVLPLQDPFVTRIGGHLILGGVKIHKIGTMQRIWRMAFYSGKTLRSLNLFFEGPKGMKDVRLKQLSDGRILVLTRPQLGKGGRGKIGYCVLDTMDQLSNRKLIEAPIFMDQFTKGEWGGANDIHILKNGLIGVIGHIAEFDGKGCRHYYSMLFTLDLKTGRHTPLEIIATRKDFLNGPAKRSDLKDVVFSGGAIRTHSGLILYAGTSDTEAQRLVMDDPFLKYES